MTEKELLELAAKAAGIDGQWTGIPGIDARVGLCIGADYWNPRTDAGDRYRLARAVKGNLYFSGRRGCFEIPSDSEQPPIREYFEIGDEAAEGVAIVRAAAEIGRMK